MGSIAGANIQLLFLTSMEHDLQANLSRYNDQKMQLSSQSIFLAERKSQVYSKLQQSGQLTAKQEAIIHEIEANESKLAAFEKMIDMKVQQLNTQLEQVSQRKQAEQKRLQQNIQGAFSYGLGGGR